MVLDRNMKGALEIAGNLRQVGLNDVVIHLELCCSSPLIHL